jgi:multiple sugar transport system permease protein
MGGFALFTLLPIIGALVVAFTVWPLGGTPSFAGLSNIRLLITDDPVFLRTVVTTLVFVLGYVPLNIAVSLGLAAWISPRIRGRNAYRVLFFLPVVTPVVANAAVWELMLMPNGVVDSLSMTLFDTGAPNFLGSSTWALPSVILMSLWMGFGYNLLVFSSALDSVPESLLDAARIDGAGSVRTFFAIKLPLISPAIFFAAIMTVITSFQVFVQPYILTGGGPANATTTVVMFVYRQGFQFFKLGYASAAALVLFAMVLTVTAVGFLLQRRWVHYD